MEYLPRIADKMLSKRLEAFGAVLIENPKYYFIILTGGQMAYTRPDGVKIIPLACLKD